MSAPRTHLAQRWRMLTSPLRMLPDFIIPGEAKCGTSSLYHYLTQHPQVLRADVKEPNNFLEYGGSMLLCRMHYPLRWRSWGGPRITGEASAEYFSKHRVPGIVAAALPDVKIIILLRNPVTRAYSDHQMFFKDGREKAPFATAARLSLRWLADPDTLPLADAAGQLNHNPVRYVQRGVYLPSLLRWQGHFPADRMLILRSEDLFADPQRVTAQAWRFLGLSEVALRDVAPRKRGTYASPVDRDTLRQLADFYRPHNEALYRHLGRDLGWEEEAERIIAAAAP